MKPSNFKLGIIVWGLFIVIFLFLAAMGRAACTADVTVVFTNGYMVDKLCRDISGKSMVSDTGKPILPYPMSIIGGCTNGIMMILPDDLNPVILVHEFNHLMDARCPKHKKGLIHHPDDHTFSPPKEDSEEGPKDPPEKKVEKPAKVEKKTQGCTMKHKTEQKGDE